MKKIIYIIALVAFASVFSACTEEEVKPQNNNNGTTETGKW